MVQIDQLGASTYVPYFAGLIFDLDPEKYQYLKEIEKAGAWEGVMLLGSLVGGFITSIFITKSFRFSLVPTAWKRYRGSSVRSRLIWSFFPGFFMIIGARLQELHKWTLHVRYESTAISSMILERCMVFSFFGGTGKTYFY